MKSSVLEIFVQDLINYIDDCFANDSRVPKTKAPQGQLAFTKNLIQETKKSFYVVNCLGNSPKNETLNATKTLQLNVQIDVFSLAGTFGGKQYLPEGMSIVLQNAISDYMEELKFGDYNENIILMREVTSSPAMPYDNGDRAYFSSLRYQIEIMRDYVS